MVSSSQSILRSLISAVVPSAVIKLGAVPDFPADSVVRELGLDVHSCEIESEASARAMELRGGSGSAGVCTPDPVDFLRSVDPRGGLGECIVCVDGRLSARALRQCLRVVFERGPGACVVIDRFAAPDATQSGSPATSVGMSSISVLFGLVPAGHVIYFPDFGASCANDPPGFCVLAPAVRASGVEGLRGGDYPFWLRLHVHQKSLNDRQQAGSDASLRVFNSRTFEAVRREISELSHSASSERARLLTELGQKEHVIRELARALDAERAERAQVAAVHRELVAKESVIQELSAALAVYRAGHRLRGRLPLGNVQRAWAQVRGRCGLSPRLGVLNQHSPRPLLMPPSRRLPRPCMLPDVTLVTPSYRQGEFIERTIVSVLGQQYPKLQYVVQDGGSDDQTRHILSAYSGRLARCCSEADSGQSQAINRGFTDTSGEIMGWLNSDDMLMPGALRRVAATFHNNPDVDVVYGNRVIVDRHDRQVGRWILPGHDGEVLSWADFIPQESLFWRRRVWDRVGARIDETFRFAMDWDLLIRFRAVGARFLHVPHVLGAFRVHRGQKTDGTMEQIGLQEMSRIRYGIHGRVPSDLEVNQHLKSFMRRHVTAELRYGAVRRLTHAWWRPVIWPRIGGGSA